MSQITPITLDDSTVIYIKVSDTNDIAPISPEPNPNNPTELTRTSYGKADKGLQDILGNSPQQQIQQHFQSIENTIRAYTTYTLNAFRQVANANIDKVTLEFGIGISGKAGIPYVTEGSAEGNLKVTVECSFKDQQLNQL